MKAKKPLNINNNECLVCPRCGGQYLSFMHVETALFEHISMKFYCEDCNIDNWVLAVERDNGNSSLVWLETR